MQIVTEGRLGAGNPEAWNLLLISQLRVFPPGASPGLSFFIYKLNGGFGLQLRAGFPNPTPGTGIALTKFPLGCNKIG